MSASVDNGNTRNTCSEQHSEIQSVDNDFPFHFSPNQSIEYASILSVFGDFGSSLDVLSEYNFDVAENSCLIASPSSSDDETTELCSVPLNQSSNPIPGEKVTRAEPRSTETDDGLPEAFPVSFDVSKSSDHGHPQPQIEDVGALLEHTESLRSGHKRLTSHALLSATRLPSSELEENSAKLPKHDVHDLFLASEIGEVDEFIKTEREVAKSKNNDWRSDFSSLDDLQGKVFN